MLCISTAYVIARCLSVHLAVCHVRALYSKRVIVASIFVHHPEATILVFTHRTGWRYFDGNPPNGGVECKGYDKMIFHKYLAVSQKR